jgi:hypothetical protein
MCICFIPMHATCPAHPIFLDSVLLYEHYTTNENNFAAQQERWRSSYTTSDVLHWYPVIRLAKQAPSWSAFRLRAPEADRLPSGQTTDGTARWYLCVHHTPWLVESTGETAGKTKLVWPMLFPTALPSLPLLQVSVYTLFLPVSTYPKHISVRVEPWVGKRTQRRLRYSDFGSHHYIENIIL